MPRAVASSARDVTTSRPARSITTFKVREKYEAGLRLLHSGHVLAAIQQFQEASFFDAEDALPVVALAECYVFLCDLRSAIRCYRRALWSLHKRKRTTAVAAAAAAVTAAAPVAIVDNKEEEASKAIRAATPLSPQLQRASPTTPPPPQERPGTAQFSPASVFLSGELLNAMTQGRTVPVDATLTANADPPEDEVESKYSLHSDRAAPPPPLPQEDAADAFADESVVSIPSPSLLPAEASTTTGDPHELTAAEVRFRLAGVLDALGLALFQVGSVEQALRCTTEALELLAAAETASDHAGGNPEVSMSAVNFLSRKVDPYLSEPTIALHRSVFLMALQREEEAEDLLERHYKKFEDCRAQSAPLLIQLYCNRQAFRKGRLLLESQEEGSSSGSAHVATPAAAAAATTEAQPSLVNDPSGEAVEDEDAEDHRAAGSVTLEPEKSEDTPAVVAASDSAVAPAAFPPLPTSASLTVAKYIFTELYARYRSAALASDDEDSVTRCLDVYPNDVDLLFRRAQLRIAAGDLKRSIKDLFRCVQDTNGEHKAAIEAMTSVLFAIGSSLDGESEVQNAVTYYSESLKWRPDNVLVLLARGDCYTKMESFQEALADYEAILNYAPGHRQAQGRIADLHDLWGRKFFAMDKPAEAEAEFTHAIKTDGTNPEFYYHRALCRLKLNQGQYALRDVLSCKELNPTAPHLRAFVARYMAPMQLPAVKDADRSSNVSRAHHGAATTTTTGPGGRRAASTRSHAAASKWYGSRTPPPPPVDMEGSCTSSDRVARRPSRPDYALSLQSSSRAASVTLPPLPTHRPPRASTTEGWVRGCQTTLHARPAESLAHTK